MPYSLLEENKMLLKRLALYQADEGSDIDVSDLL
jgi:hypothetical protein